jgi:hypothetical protein
MKNKDSTYKVLANKSQLEKIGISYDITGLKGKHIRTWPDGELTLEITHSIGDFSFTNEFDLPKDYCELINETR